MIITPGGDQACAAPVQPSLADNRPLHLGKIILSQTRVPRYEKVEFRLELQGAYENVFDPQEIEVNGRFRSPDGKTVIVPGFYFQDYTRRLRGRVEILTPKGPAGWRIRFAPTRAGRYTVVVTARDRTGKRVQSQPVRFECIPSQNPGFVRRSPTDARYFIFDNGRPYVPIGANVCWGGARGTFDYDDWLPRYGTAGCCYFRVWLGPGWTTFGLERVGELADRYGVGKFDLANAWRLDYVLDLAARNGLYVMLCIDSFNELRKEREGAYGGWGSTPHNAANGGPLKEPREFWTDPVMLRLYRNKLRYLVARYGWSTHVLSWEFWNEVDIISPAAYLPEEVAHWHAQMSDYLRSTDPWKHLQTTSFANSSGRPEIDRLPQMDYTQTHNYGARDTASELADWQKRKETYGKPHYVGEFGTDAGGGEQQLDPEGIALHSGLWSTLLSGSAGSAMLWWWDSHIHPNNLYYHFAALNRFVKGVNFSREGFQRIGDASFVYRGSPARKPYSDLSLEGPISWEPSRSNRSTTVRVDAQGTVRIHEEVAGILHGTVNHPDLHNPLTFETNLPHPTRLRLRVTAVSGYGGAHLIVKRDGQQVIDKDMPDPDGDAGHETLLQYNGDYGVDIPAGAHDVQVENVGKDWIYVDYLLENAVRKKGPDLRLFGLRGPRVSLLWIDNAQNTWHKVRVLKRPPQPQPPSLMIIPKWKPGRYRVLFWDTYRGRPMESRQVIADKDGLRLELPSIEKDIAVKIKRIGSRP